MSSNTRWKRSTSSDTVQCISCGNTVDTPEDILSCFKGSCPECGKPLSGSERRSTSVMVTAPEAGKGETL